MKTPRRRSRSIGCSYDFNIRTVDRLVCLYAVLYSMECGRTSIRLFRDIDK